MTQEPALIGMLAVVVVAAFIAIAFLLLGVSMAGEGFLLRSFEALWRWLNSDLSLMVIGVIVILGLSFWLLPYISIGDSPGAADDATPSVAISATPAPTTAGAAVTYVVRRGDTLRTIATQLLGDEAAWTRIYAANRPLIPDPDSLVIGTRLTIPSP